MIGRVALFRFAIALSFGVVVAATALYHVASSNHGLASVSGTEIVGPDGSPLTLRGINLGNWLVPEGYMFGFKVATAPWQIRQVVKELVGVEADNRFWEQWRATFITQEDIRYIRSTGMNV